MRVLILILNLVFSLTFVSTRPGYNSLSEAIMSSMTNLWNEKQAGSSTSSSDASDEWWDLLEDSDSENKSSDGKTPASITYELPMSESSSYGINHEDKKSQYSQHPGKKKPLFRKQFPNKPLNSRNFNVKSPRRNPGPLHRALYNSYPISFEELLHYYDYLDYSDEEPCEHKDSENSSTPLLTKPNFKETITSMLTKFISTLTGFVEKPLVVQANVCCGNSPAPSQVNPDVVATNNPTESSVNVPSYIDPISSTSRYAENQEDIVKQLKEQYDKMVRLLETVEQSKKQDLIEAKVELKPTESAVLTTEENPEDISEKVTFIPGTIHQDNAPKVPETTIKDNDVEVPVVTIDDKVEPTTVSSITTEATVAPNSNPKEAVETLATVEVIPESVTKLPLVNTDSTTDTETSPLEESTEIPESRAYNFYENKNRYRRSSTLKRKRRSTWTGDTRKTKKDSRDSNVTEAILTTTASSVPDLDYDDIRHMIGNNTAMLDTMVLNEIPIVEHIHEHLLEREKKSQTGEWQPKRSLKDCEKSVVPKSPGDVKVMADHPHFIEIVTEKLRGSSL